MASAYSTIAAQGEQTAWYTVQEVKNPNGGTRYRAHPKPTRVFKKDVMADATYAMQQVVKSGGTGEKASALGRPVAGKTGTAALRPDTTTSAWFVGFTPQLSAAVDFYKGKGKADLDGVGGLSTFFGGEYPTRIWTAFMQGAMEGKQVEDFPPPAFVGEAVNPGPTRTQSASPTTTTATPSPTVSATASPSASPPAPPSPTSSGNGTVTISPPAVEPSGSGGGGNGPG
jgi:membrane peptidoglycan carboxypeptidase